ncbi:hypothetical protein IGI39_004686 [Enterococcus sp. AZ135]|uniref:hypothetical protein n=1 Tax=unclassified Enterococcus TaxID=2608891 RepID=UPI003F21707A
MSNEKLLGKILYNKRMSEDWLELLENAPAFNRFDLKAISALLVAPCELGTLIIRDDQCSFLDNDPLKTVKLFHETHRFFDYSVTRRCFPAIDGFSSYKVPFVNWHYALCPLEQPESCTWINPLEIYDLRTVKQICYAELTNGLILEIPTQMRSFMEQAEKAIYALCYLRREYSLTQEYYGAPLDYIQLPDTPFHKRLRKRPLLQQWITQRGVFHQRYFSEMLNKHKKE